MLEVRTISPLFLSTLTELLWFTTQYTRCPCPGRTWRLLNARILSRLEMTRQRICFIAKNRIHQPELLASNEKSNGITILKSIQDSLRNLVTKSSKQMMNPMKNQMCHPLETYEVMRAYKKLMAQSKTTDTKSNPQAAQIKKKRSSHSHHFERRPNHNEKRK